MRLQLRVSLGPCGSLKQGMGCGDKKSADPCLLDPRYPTRFLDEGSADFSSLTSDPILSSFIPGNKLRNAKDIVLRNKAVAAGSLLIPGTVAGGVYLANTKKGKKAINKYRKPLEKINARFK